MVSNIDRKIWGYEKKKNKSADVNLMSFVWLCPLINENAKRSHTILCEYLTIRLQAQNFQGDS